MTEVLDLVWRVGSVDWGGVGGVRVAQQKADEPGEASRGQIIKDLNGFMKEIGLYPKVISHQSVLRGTRDQNYFIQELTSGFFS